MKNKKKQHHQFDHLFIYVTFFILKYVHNSHTFHFKQTQGTEMAAPSDPPTAHQLDM